MKGCRDEGGWLSANRVPFKVEHFFRISKISFENSNFQSYAWLQRIRLEIH